MTSNIARYVIAVVVAVVAGFTIDHEIARTVVVLAALTQAFAAGVRIGDSYRRPVTASVRQLRAEIDQYATADLEECAA